MKEEKKPLEKWDGDISEEKHIALHYCKYVSSVDSAAKRIEEYGDRRVSDIFRTGIYVFDHEGNIHEVKKYIKDQHGEISVWTDTWYGRHVIGQDCNFVLKAREEK